MLLRTSKSPYTFIRALMSFEISLLSCFLHRKSTGTDSEDMLIWNTASLRMHQAYALKLSGIPFLPLETSF
jgi:hypothetical protein